MGQAAAHRTGEYLGFGAFFVVGGLAVVVLLWNALILLAGIVLLVVGWPLSRRLRRMVGGRSAAAPAASPVPLMRQPISAELLAGSPTRARREGFWQGLQLGAAVLSVVISALIVLSLARETWTFATQVDWGSLWEIGWFPRRGLYDIKTLVVASLLVTGIAMLLAGPIGLGAAIYMSEYAGPKTRKWLKPTLEILAGIPSVVLGFFALTFIAPQIIGRFSEANAGSILAAGIGVGILTIPLVASISEDAMRAVPNPLREASAGLGARKMTTTIKVVLPAAVSGLAAAFIVAISRAIGETMVVFIAGGAGDVSTFTADPLDGSLTMTAAMASLSSGTDSVVGEGLTFQSLFFVGSLLFLVTLSLNILANRFVSRIREAY